VRSALDAIIVMDHEGKLVEFNPTAEKIFGYARADVVGKPLADLIIPERLRARHRAGIAHFLATGEGPVLNQLLEMPALRADGTEFPAEFAIIAIPGAEPPLFTAFLRDITQRKEIEESLVARAEDLAQADRSKDEFLAMLAHELRNPLAPLRNASELLQSPDVSAGERTQAQGILARQIENMSRMIDDLLDVSRISRNKMEVRRRRVLLADVVSNAVETVRPAIEAAGHELTVSLPEEPVRLNGDLTRLAQVFGNLLSNSARYTEPGGRIGLSATREGDTVTVQVRDTGIGIPAEFLPNLFDMFSQVDRSIERSTGGLGIGLALVKGVVEMHGGTVEAASDGHGKGSTFTVRLPAPEADAEARETPPGQAMRLLGSKRRVLVVDDNRDSATSMAMMLELIGYEVRTAHDGVEAVDAAGQFRPQVVLMDVGMPRLNGYDATRRIREQPWGEGMVIIALTGWGQEVDRARSKEAGCDGHLVKPVNLPDLERLLNELTPLPADRESRL
jgi:PAS domain S-box-containing protein